MKTCNVLLRFFFIFVDVLNGATDSVIEIIVFSGAVTGCSRTWVRAMTIFVGNLNYAASQEELTNFFSQNWEVRTITIPLDRETARPRGFAFVELATDAQEDNAIEEANGSMFLGRPLRLDKAKPRT